MSKLTLETDVHRHQPLLTSGDPLASARSAMLLLHGRGSDAHDIMGLAAELSTAGMAYLAPQAANNTWYSYGFLQPQSRNEPALSSAIARVRGLLDSAREQGIPTQRTFLAGFSQGACLALETAARAGLQLGGVFAFSGGLIGSELDVALYSAGLTGTPVFIGCDERDPHIPASRVRASGELLTTLGATVTVRLYSDLGHSINRDEIAAARAILRTALV
ncbi:dienelactone hydrolase family protein [candidate division KSB1 bacterium]|nr:dienelactone hydrolase family protein [candidate division KSB1 bacterium]